MMRQKAISHVLDLAHSLNYAFLDKERQLVDIGISRISRYSCDLAQSRHEAEYT